MSAFAEFELWDGTPVHLRRDLIMGARRVERPSGEFTSVLTVGGGIFEVTDSIDNVLRAAKGES